MTANGNRNSFNCNNAQQIHDQGTVVYPRNNYTIERTYCEILQKNKPQSNSVIGGEMTLIK